MSKHCFLDDFLEERLYVIQPEGFVDPKDAKRYANSIDPSMDWSKHLGVGTYAFDEVIKVFGFIQSLQETSIYKKVSGSTTTF